MQRGNSRGRKQRHTCLSSSIHVASFIVALDFADSYSRQPHIHPNHRIAFVYAFSLSNIDAFLFAIRKTKRGAFTSSIFSPFISSIFLPKCVTLSHAVFASFFQPIDIADAFAHCSTYLVQIQLSSVFCIQHKQLLTGMDSLRHSHLSS